MDDPVAFIDPRDFPSLMGNASGPSTAVKPVPNSAWNSAPVGIHNNSASNGTTGGAAFTAGADKPKWVPRPPPPTPNSPPQDQEQVNMEAPPPQQAWNGYSSGGPMMMPPMPPVQQQQYYGGPQMMVDPNTGYPIDPAYFQAMMYHQYTPPYGMHMPMESSYFNAEAKEFIPGSSG
jgi:hypothetical protein